jgi:tetratricopeptide (TPR) repeat protein
MRKGGNMNALLRRMLISIPLLLLISCAAIGIYSAQDHFDYGLSYFNRGEYGAAIPYFEKATELDPNFADAYLYLGRSYLNLGQWSKAVPPLRAALRLAPEKMKHEITDLLTDAVMGVGLQKLETLDNKEEPH